MGWAYRDPASSSFQWASIMRPFAFLRSRHSSSTAPRSLARSSSEARCGAADSARTDSAVDSSSGLSTGTSSSYTVSSAQHTQYRAHRGGVGAEEKFREEIQGQKLEYHRVLTCAGIPQDSHLCWCTKRSDLCWHTTECSPVLAYHRVSHLC